ncbi:MAG TPA: LysM peptidoglycan-binding domain-containing protein [Clostridia bacterium]
MKKRFVLKNRKRFSRFIAFLAVLVLISVPVIKVYSASARPSEFKTVTVKPGDTLWAIAGKTGVSGDIRETIFKIKELNGLHNSEIYAGTELIVPEN